MFFKISIKNQTSLDNWMSSGKKLTRNFKVPRATSLMAKILRETKIAKKEGNGNVFQNNYKKIEPL